MNAAIKSLMDDHRYIERMLGSLDSYSAAGPELARRDALAGYADFIREFVDKCHHGKEEERLFKQMHAHGFPTHAGPVAMMLQEHQMGRMWGGELTKLSAGSGDWPIGDWAALQRSAGELGLLMRDHIRKEDEVLYPMAMMQLPPAVFDALASDFIAFENSLPRGGLEKWRPLGEQLCAAYPPAAATGLPIQQGGCGTGCGHG